MNHPSVLWSLPSLQYATKNSKTQNNKPNFHPASTYRSNISPFRNFSNPFFPRQRGINFGFKNNLYFFYYPAFVGCHLPLSFFCNAVKKKLQGGAQCLCGLDEGAAVQKTSKHRTTNQTSILHQPIVLTFHHSEIFPPLFSPASGGLIPVSKIATRKNFNIRVNINFQKSKIHNFKNYSPCQINLTVQILSLQKHQT